MDFYIKTFGCQSNVYDSQKMIDLMKSFQHTQVDTDKDADIIILNTCHIRKTVEHKVFSELGRYRILKKSKAHLQVVVMGCVAQIHGTKLMQYGVDIVLGTQSYHELPRKLGMKVVINNFTPQEKFDALPQPTNCAVSGFIAIQEGCNKFCTYCVVPYTRGREFCRPAEQIYTEVKRLIELGMKEIILSGQNVNAYLDSNNTRLSDLIRHISDLGVTRMSYTSSHPSNVTEDLIEVHKLDALLPHLHFAVQSGSNRILKLMKRSHTVEQYINIVNRVRQVRPDITFSTDIIVGFPGETEEDFELTLQLISTIKFIQIYYFIYSPREGTPAANMQDNISLSVKKHRLERLKNLLSIYQYEHNKHLLHSNCDVLIENKKHGKNEYFGKNKHMQPVHILSDKELSIGNVYNVYIEKAFLRGLEATII